MLDRLVEAGLVAAPSDFDKTLEQVTNNLILGSKLTLAGEIHCQVPLTTPLELLAVGHTILVSKGLVDVLPSQEDLGGGALASSRRRSPLATRLMRATPSINRPHFLDQATFQQIPMNHS